MTPGGVDRRWVGPGQGGVAAVDRALAVLAAFSLGDDGLSLSALALRSGLYKSTILRLAQSLLRHGYLQRIDDGRYQIGPTPLRLGAIYQHSLRLGDIVLSLMQGLAAQSGEGVSFYVRQEGVRVCLHRVDSKHAIRDHVREGDVLPLECGSAGRVLSAFSGAPGQPYESIRRGLVYASVVERDEETAGVSAPVFGRDQRLLGALTVAGPRSRVDDLFLAGAQAPLLWAAARATAALGGDASALEAAFAAASARLGAAREAPSP